MGVWCREVITKALLFVAQAKRPGELVSEGAALELNRKGISAEQVAAEAGFATRLRRIPRKGAGTGAGARAR
eukprot:14769717-Alexandrium_andersonii.AAC.1